jgi:hypothetical protein
MSGTKGRFRLVEYEQRRELTGRASGPLCIIEQWSSIVVSSQEYFYYLFILLYPQAIVANLSCLTAP